MKNTKKIRSLLCTCAMMLSTFSFTSVQVKAAIPFKGAISKVDSVTVEGNVAKISFNDGAVSGKVTFLENGIFRYNVDPANEFNEYAKPNDASHVARIQAQPDDSSSYAHPSATKSEDELKFTLSNGNVTIQFEKSTGRMSVLNKNGQVVVNEKAPLELGGTTKQTLATDEKESFYGGGTQNGRFTHKGEIIDIENNNKYTDGGVSSPNPFYWSSAGYGVMRNTFASGAYDFAKTNASNVVTSHSEAEYDAYYFVSDKTAIDKVAQDILKEYYKVTGDPVLLPEYGFYLGHLNCYNRDGW